MADLKKLREWRVRRERDVSIGAAVLDVAKEMKRRRKAVGGAGETWESIVPAPVRERCQVVGVVRGVMTVRVRDAATRFEVDRWLRGGGEAELLRRAGVKRVKVVA